MKSQNTFGLLPRRLNPIALLTGLLAMALLACGSPRQEEIILKESFVRAPDGSDLVLDLHQVEIIQVLPTETYLFMEVSEKDKRYWIATGLGNVRPGSTYYFNEAVRKFDFESKALERVYDSIYLVTRLVPKSRLSSLDKRIFDPHNPEAAGKPADSLEIPTDSDAVPITIQELLDAPELYENRWVELSGTCVKVNFGIMNRNWVHLKGPGETGGEVVLTTQEDIQLGESVRVEALVRRNRDFGAGYVYELLLEEGFRID